MKNTLIATIFLLSLVSCKTVLYTVKGIKDPKLETYTSTQKYLYKNDIDTARVVYFKDLNSFVYASKMKLLTIPNALFFDEKGFFVDYKKSPADCNAKVGGFIDDLDSFQSAESDSTRTIADFKKLLVSPNKKLLSEHSDITVFIMWTKWSGALNKEKAFEWVQLLEEAKKKGVSVNYYLLNADFQENWNLTPKQKADYGL